LRIDSRHPIRRLCFSNVAISSIEKSRIGIRALGSAKAANNVELWREPKGNEFVPSAHYFVGGNTKFYGGSTIAFQDRRSMAEVQPTNGQDIHHRRPKPTGIYRSFRPVDFVVCEFGKRHHSTLANSRVLARFITIREIHVLKEERSSNRSMPLSTASHASCTTSSATALF